MRLTYISCLFPRHSVPDLGFGQKELTWWINHSLAPRFLCLCCPWFFWMPLPGLLLIILQNTAWKFSPLFILPQSSKMLAYPFSVFQSVLGLLCVHFYSFVIDIYLSVPLNCELLKSGLWPLSSSHSIRINDWNISSCWINICCVYK